MGRKRSLKPLHHLRRDDEVKAYLHPVRMRILAELAKEPDTISGVARKLETHPANLSHHFRKLVAAGLVRLMETRSVGHNVEKLYAPVAAKFDVTPPPGHVRNANETVLTFLREDLDHGIAQLAGHDEEAVIGLVANARIDAETFRDFCAKLQELIKEFSKRQSTDGPRYSLNLSLYPSDRDYGPTGRLHIRKKDGSKR